MCGSIRLGTVLFVLVVAGCGGDGNPLGRVAVKGKVTLAGQPLSQGAITFEPTSGGTSAGATIEHGTYSITAEKGLPPGTYVVRISAPEGGPQPGDAPGEATEVAKETIPAEFNAQSQLKATVEKDGKNTFDFEIPAAAK